MNTKLCGKAYPLTHYFVGLSILLLAAAGCLQKKTNDPLPGVFVSVLGIAQDAGFPQADCEKDCCQQAWNNPSLRRQTVSLGIVDQSSHISWMIDASPDFPAQQHVLQHLAPQNRFGGIWLTHAHMGHYTGLMYLGREVMGASGVPVFAMPRMQHFLDSNGPWSQLVTLQNIALQTIVADSLYTLSSQIAITPMLVPHRDEYSETVGYLIQGPQKRLLFIPDIDKWSRWEQDIRGWIQKVDYALLDGTFFENGEIPGRDMAEIPHPFVRESLGLFNDLSPEEKARIYFIHFNHTNPLLQAGSSARAEVLQSGMHIAEEGMILEL